MTKLLVAFVSVLLAAQSIVSSRDQTGQTVPESIGIQVLALPPLAEQPKLWISRRWRAELYHSLAGSGRSMKNAIAAGFSLGQILDWPTRVNERRDLQQRGIMDIDLACAQEAVLQALQEVSSLPSLRDVVPGAASLLHSTGGPWQWPLAEVDTQYKYILGDKTALAVDVVLFLKELQETGEVKDHVKRIVVSVRDENGQPYRHLVHEYLLHEILERTPLDHDQIIALTTRLFGRGIFRAPRVSSGVRTQHGLRIFTRPGQTPLGMALRTFIGSRLRAQWADLRGRWIGLSVLDPSSQTVQLHQGVLKKQEDAGLKIERQGEEVFLEEDRILRITRGFGLSVGTFADVPPISAQRVEQHLRDGSSVTLTEPQVRVLAGASQSESWLTNTLLAICELRDTEGMRLWRGLRPELAWASFLVHCAESVSSYLVDPGFDLALAVGDGLVLNDWMYPPYSFGFSRYVQMKSWPERILDDAERISDALLSYTKVTFFPRRRSLSHEVSGPTDHLRQPRHSPSSATSRSKSVDILTAQAG